MKIEENGDSILSSQENIEISKTEKSNDNIINNNINELSSIKNKNKNKKEDNNKMRDDLKSFIMDNRRKLYHRLEGMEPEEEFSLPDDNIFSSKTHYGNIGGNIVLFNKYVIGIKKNILLLIITLLGISLTWFGWIFSCGNFYSKNIYII